MILGIIFGWTCSRTTRAKENSYDMCTETEKRNGKRDEERARERENKMRFEISRLPIDKVNCLLSYFKPD